MKVDQLINFEACRGGSIGCPNSCFPHQDVINELEKLAADSDWNKRFKERIDGPVLYHHVFKISLSGCPNSCSQPQIKDIGIQGQRVPKVDTQLCNGCGKCSEVCPDQAVLVNEATAQIDRRRCLNCGLCVDACPTAAITAAKSGFKVLVGGKLGRKPQLAQTYTAVAVKEDLVALVETIMSIYLQEAAPGEKLADLVQKSKKFSA